jgi:hypothetical protein
VGGAVAGPFFTDRAAERKRISRALVEPQAHLLVYGPRRMGKTSTLRVVQQDLLRAGRLVVMADLSTASAPADLATRILQGATAALGRRWPDALQWLVQHFGVRVRLVTDPAGLILPSVDVGVREAPADEQRRTLAGALEAIETLARHKRAHVGVILDEFQEIHRFGAEQAEAELRGVLQRQLHVSYVLAGSDEGLIRAMTGAKRPLYKLLEPLYFAPMESAHLARWIEDRLAGAGVRARGVGGRTVEVAGPRTRDVVQLARGVFEAARSAGTATATPATVEEAFLQIVHGEDEPHRARWDGLTALQQNVLRALAVCASGLTTAATRRAFALGPQGTATKAAQALIAQGWVTKDGTAYRYDSPFARGWVILNALADVGLALPVTHLPQAG